MSIKLDLLRHDLIGIKHWFCVQHSNISEFESVNVSWKLASLFSTFNFCFSLCFWLCHMCHSFVFLKILKQKKKYTSVWKKLNASTCLTKFTQDCASRNNSAKVTAVKVSAYFIRLWMSVSQDLRWIPYF